MYEFISHYSRNIVWDWYPEYSTKSKNSQITPGFLIHNLVPDKQLHFNIKKFGIVQLEKISKITGQIMADS